MDAWRNIRAWSLVALGGAVAAGCGAGKPPKEIVDARAAYARASAGPAQQLAPDTLHQAQVTLREAERAHQARADIPDPKALGYASERKSEMAEVQARDVMDQQRRAQADQVIKQQMALRQQHGGGARGTTQGFGAIGGGPSAGSVVLFATGKSDLTKEAENELDGVVGALRAQPELHVVLDGHTDSRGSVELNDRLSQERADSVKEYLESKGIDGSRIEAKGFGESDPIAGNTTAEGRLSNRRVTITIQTTSNRPGNQPGR